MAPFTVFYGRPPPPSGPPQLTEDGAGGSQDGEDGAGGSQDGGSQDGAGGSHGGSDGGSDGGGVRGVRDRVELQDLKAMRGPTTAVKERERRKPGTWGRRAADDFDQPPAGAEPEAGPGGDEEDASREAVMGRARERLGHLVVSGVEAYQASLARNPQSGRVDILKWILGLVWDRRFERILYLV